MNFLNDSLLIIYVVTQSRQPVRDTSNQLTSSAIVGVSASTTAQFKSIQYARGITSLLSYTLIYNINVRRNKINICLFICSLNICLSFVVLVNYMHIIRWCTCLNKW